MGDYAYVAGGDSGFFVVDVSDPSAPFLVGSLDDLGYVFSVAATPDGIVCIGDTHPNQVRVLDVQDPTLPFELGSLPVPGNPWSISIAMDYAYVACGGYGLRVLDLASPAAPVEVGVYNDPPSAVVDVELSGGYAFLADLHRMNPIVDVGVPTAPVSSCPGTITGPGGRAIAIAGDCTFLANFNQGLSVFCTERSRGGTGGRRSRTGG